MPKLISKFLTGRNFTVRVGNTLFDSYHQQEGATQGSILLVTLFCMKINSIVKCLLNGVNCSLYVDDFLIWYHSKNMNSIERILQLCLNKLEHWADENGFKYSRSKTVCVHFYQQRKFHPDPTLKLYGLTFLF
jgi:potassium voltage-gated channel Eag-related subfamily H protein 8